MNSAAFIDWNLTWSLVSFIVQTILAIVAVGLSLWFYDKAKTSEKSVEVALSAIQAQTGTLERITGRQLDRLTKAVTTMAPGGRLQPLPPELSDALAAVKHLPAALETKTTQLQETAARADACAAELRTTMIAAHYYAAVANRAWQNWVPAEPSSDDGATQMVNVTAGDFWYTDQLLAGLNPELLTNNRLHHMYEWAQQIWKPYVMNTAQVYAHRQAEAARGAASEASR